MSQPATRREKRERRAKRVRSRARGTADCPRLSVFRSHRHLSAQLIDDQHSRTLASASDLKIPKPKKGAKPLARGQRAEWVGERLAELARERGITRAQFDRGRYRYHGRIAALAAGARKGGLKF